MGHVHRAGRVAVPAGHAGSPTSSAALDELMPLADTRYVLIRRETGRRASCRPCRRISPRHSTAPGSDADVLLQSRDTVSVFDLASSRERA